MLDVHAVDGSGRVHDLNFGAEYVLLADGLCFGGCDDERHVLLLRDVTVFLHKDSADRADTTGSIVVSIGSGT